MLPRLTVIDLFEIFVIGLVVHRLMISFRGTRATAIIKGLVLLVVARGLSHFLGLPMVSWLLEQATTVILVALPVVFYPELRRTLERLGRRPILRPFASLGSEDLDKFEGELIRAVRWFAAHRIGALIVIEREVGLDEYVETGVRMESQVTAELLMTVFYPNTALHDGAAIIRGDRIVAAGCFLPLTENTSLGIDLGTRHRAAVGVSEQSDACVIVVSEETGALSLAADGRLERGLTDDELRKRLREVFRQESAFGLRRLGGEWQRIGVKAWTRKGGLRLRTDSRAAGSVAAGVDSADAAPGIPIKKRPRRGNRRLWIYALALSTLLWILAPRPEVTPVDPGTMVERPVVSAIEVRGVPEGVEVVGMHEWATIHLRGSNLDTTMDVDQIQVYVDLSARDAGVHNVPVIVVPPFGVQVTEINPQFVEVRLERIIQRELPVRVAAFGLPLGAHLEVVSTEPAVVRVEGTSGRLDRIAEVIAAVRLQPESGTFTYEVMLQPVDAAGAPVLDVRLVPESVRIVTEVTPERATDPSNGALTGVENGG